MKTLDKWLLGVAIFAVCFGVFGSLGIWLNDPNIFCTEIKGGEFEREDLGVHCFKYPSERKNFTDYIISKYNLNTTNDIYNPPSNLNYNVDWNIS